MGLQEAWERSPLTQEMKEANRYLTQPKNLERLKRIAEGHRMFQTVQGLLEKAGQHEGKMRRIRGQTYFMETDGQSVLIMRNDKLIFHASDERKKGGIVQTQRMAMTEGDRQAIQRGAELIQERLRQQQRRLPKRGISL